MFDALAKKIFGSPNDRRLKAYAPKVKAISDLEPKIARLSDEELRWRTHEFRDQLANGRSLDDLLVPAFATVREVAKRTLGERHFDVQVIGGMALHEGAIAEIGAGEGKALTTTLAACLNALRGKGVHVVTVNDNLAKRDAEWMGLIYGFLGMSVGVIVHDLSDADRAAAYACDITYGTHDGFGVDYLRDNMRYEFAQMVQRGHNFAIIDEADFVLIDEACTPLTITAESDASDDESGLCNSIGKLVANLGSEDFEVDETQRAIYLTDAGNGHMANLLREAGLLTGGGLDEPQNVTLVHHINQALRAHKFFQRDKDYIVRKGEVVILDVLTGRPTPGRRYPQGLHQALEVKEHLQVQPDNVPLASITFRNYFRVYDKLAGVTCTAATEANEFAEIYKLDVVEIPTNQPALRLDEDHEVYRTAKEKINAIVAEIKNASAKMQPLLVGATSFEKSEQLAAFLTTQGYEQIDFSAPAALVKLYEAARSGKPSKLFTLLNARFQEQEAYIVAEAGVPGAITIVTDMGVRGADIQLGGNVEMRVALECSGLEGAAREAREAEIREEVAAFKEKAIAAGGLYVIGTEHHENQRMDNQLRACSGRDGDPGRSKFFASLQDDLMRILGSDRLDSILVKLGRQEGEAVVHSWINNAIEEAQHKLTARNFEIRRNILKFDEVMNDQRMIICLRRREIMAQESIEETVNKMRVNAVEAIVKRRIPPGANAAMWDVEALAEDVRSTFNLNLPIAEWAREKRISYDKLTDRLVEAANYAYAARVQRNTPHLSRMIEKQVALQALDHLWREQLMALDRLRQTSAWRGTNGLIGWQDTKLRDLLNDYNSEALARFKYLFLDWDMAVTSQLMRVEVSFEAPPSSPQGLMLTETVHSDRAAMDAAAADQMALDEINARLAAADLSPRALGAAPQCDPSDPTTWGRVGRNETCPCGSGKKYKHCHGALL